MKTLQGECYSIVLRVDVSRNLVIGKLGSYFFPSGYYIYTGRAVRGLEKRIQRHLNKKKNCHWHIDYMTVQKDIDVVQVLIHSSRAVEECDIVKHICSLPGASIPVPGFGASDCDERCGAHLVYLNENSQTDIYAL